MTTLAADHVLLDTNILLTATDEGRPDHRLALNILNEWPSQGATCYTSPQVLREYLVVCTRPASVNGLGLSQAEALGNVRALRGRLRFLDESEKVFDALANLLDAVPCVGKQTHDANLVATASAHGIGAIATRNVSDFTRFENYVQLMPLV
jgi:predicted nucleic acid-binding protein